MPPRTALTAAAAPATAAATDAYSYQKSDQNVMRKLIQKLFKVCAAFVTSLVDQGKHLALAFGVNPRNWIKGGFSPCEKDQSCTGKNKGKERREDREEE